MGTGTLVAIVFPPSFPPPLLLYAILSETVTAVDLKPKLNCGPVARCSERRIPDPKIAG